MNVVLIRPFAIFFFATLGAALAGPINLPEVKDSRFSLSLFASEPDIVTPIGIAIDGRNRIFVVESHTHRRRPNYPGPEQDRIKLFQDTTGDGKPDAIEVFAEVPYWAMNLAFGPDEKLYLSHRNGIAILHEREGAGRCDKITTVLEVDTPGLTPHNGVSGIAFSPDGWLYVGWGENRGENYTVKGADGRAHSGGGEGGNIFRCRPDGSGLELVATGFWNTFALEFDRAGRLLAVDNDPHSRPPCRLLHIVPGGDYGYRFRWGNRGLHPFISWNGELPGTLPMMSGTGEAPSGILDGARMRLPDELQSALFVTSWGDYAIEYYLPRQHGASLRSERQILVQGDERFRPVGIAAAPDGAIYFTDWVDRSYPVHGKGRIWRLAINPDVPVERPARPPVPLSLEENRMRRLLSAHLAEDFPRLIEGLSDPDPFIVAAAFHALAHPVHRNRILEETNSANPRVRLGALLALRRAGYKEPVPLLEQWLADPDEAVRRMALVWAGEEALAPLARRLPVALSAGPVSADLFRAYTTAAQILAAEGGAIELPEDSPAEVRALVLQFTSERDETRPIQILTRPDYSGEIQVRLEAARALSGSSNSQAIAALKSVARDTGNPGILRAEAVLALAYEPPASLAELIGLLEDSSREVRIETVRTFRQAAHHEPIRRALEQAYKRAQAEGTRTLLEQLEFALRLPETSRRIPRPSSPEEWRHAAAHGGNPDSGRRVFYHPSVGCANCHQIDNHGRAVGTDLSAIARSSDRTKLMDAILDPSREIAPEFVQHVIETIDGELYAGIWSGEAPDGSVSLIQANGQGVIVPRNRIHSHETTTDSLMPDGLVEAMTVEDFRDLLAFLLSRN